MALSTANHESFYSDTGSDADRASASLLTKLEAQWDSDRAKGCDVYLNHPDLGPIIFQLQQMQDELNYLRTEISANKDKTGITTSQANAITANTAKTTFPGLGTSSTTALAGDTTTISTTQALNISTAAKLTSKITTARQANISKSTVITFGEFTTTGSGKTLAYSLPITVVETDTSGKSPVTTTKTGSITLT